MPHDLNALWRGNAPVLTRLVFQRVKATLLSLLADPKYLGAKPGIVAALHTWGQTLVLHPHIHCLVTGGGSPRRASGVRCATGFCCRCAW